MESKTLRIRIGVDSSTKGVLTFSSTVEGEGYTQGQLLIESDDLVASLKKRYPLASDEKKGKE